MEDLLDIHVEIVEDTDKIIVVKARIDYKGNTFEALGAIELSTSMRKADAIGFAQDYAVNKAKDLAGIQR